MRVDDLDHKELLELDPEGGLIRFAGQRALLLDAVAMGLLRKYLVENFGLTAARTVLTQFGFAHGWRMAEALRADFKWDSDEDWRQAGIRIHTLGGLFRVEPANGNPLSKDGVMLVASYEAEQHLLHFGRSERDRVLDSVRANQRLPQPYLGQGDLRFRRSLHGQWRCGLPPIGRPREEWGESGPRNCAFLKQRVSRNVSMSRCNGWWDLEDSRAETAPSSPRCSSARRTDIRRLWGSSPRA